MELNQIRPDLLQYPCGWNLDFDNFEVKDIFPQGGRFAAIVMRDKRSEAEKPLCVQYRGCGHYFSTHEELCKYMFRRGWI